MRIIDRHPGWATGIDFLCMQQALSRTGRQTTWSAEAAQNRLSSTAFLAALFHGILILGITFSSGSSCPGNLTSSME